MRIGLLWHSFYSGNLGVSALSDANMSLIRDAAGGEPIEFVLFGPRGDRGFHPPSELADSEYIEVSSIRRAAYYFKRLSECDFVYDIGAGDSFADIYGPKRLTKVAGLKFIAALARSAPVLSPQTIGPFNGMLARFFGQRALAVCAHVFARDSLSQERASALMGKSAAHKLSLATDVAFALERFDSWPESYPQLEQNKTHVGLNVSGLLYQGGYTGQNQFGLSLNYKELIDGLIAEFSARDDIILWLIPHVYQIERPAMESDLEVSRKLADATPRARLAPLFYNARDAKTFIAGMDLVLAARMHVTVAAVSSGVACVPMSYSIKFQGLFESLDYPFTLDLKSLDQRTMHNESMAALDRIPEMAECASASASKALERLKPYREYLVAQYAKRR